MTARVDVLLLEGIYWDDFDVAPVNNMATSDFDICLDDLMILVMGH